MKVTFLSGLFVVLLSCSTPKAVIAPRDKQEARMGTVLDSIAIKKWGQQYVKEESSNGRFVLVTHKTKDFNNLFMDIDFLIFDNENQMITWEDKLKQGSVYWISGNEIIAISIQKNSPQKSIKTKYSFDVYTGEKTVIK